LIGLRWTAAHGGELQPKLQPGTISFLVIGRDAEEVRRIRRHRARPDQLRQGLRCVNMAGYQGK
jgi:hypothetical protein